MSKIKESFQHHENIGRRYKNLSYIDTHDINEAFKSVDEEVQKLKDALKEISKFQYETGEKDAILISKWAEQVLENNNA